MFKSKSSLDDTSDGSCLLSSDYSESVSILSEASCSTDTSSLEYVWVERLPHMKNCRNIQHDDRIIICSEEQLSVNKRMRSSTDEESFDGTAPPVVYRLDAPISDQATNSIDLEINQKIQKTIFKHSNDKNDNLDFVRPYLFDNFNYPSNVQSSSDNSSHRSDSMDYNDLQRYIELSLEQCDSSDLNYENELGINTSRRHLLLQMQERIKKHSNNKSNTDRPTYIEIDENQWLVKMPAVNKRDKLHPCECRLESKNMGMIGCGQECLNRMTMVECDPSNCPCGCYCSNQRITRHENAPIAPFRTEWKGWGIKALSDIHPGTFVIEYVGEVLSEQQFLNRLSDYEQSGQRDYYFMSLDRSYIIDATIKGNLSRLINHSCDPNCITQKWTVKNRIRIAIVACRFIKEGQELNFDYKYETLGNENTVCYCKSLNCRGFIGSKCTNPAWLQQSEDSELSLSENSHSDMVYHSSFSKSLDLPSEIITDADMQKCVNAMLCASSIAVKVCILTFLLNNENDYSILLLDHGGLHVIYTWFMDMEDKYPFNITMRLKMLELLHRLPLKTKSAIQQSKIYGIITKWTQMMEWSPIDQFDDFNQLIEKTVEKLVNIVALRMNNRLLEVVQKSKEICDKWISLPDRTDDEKMVLVKKKEGTSEKAQMYKDKGFRVYRNLTKQIETPDNCIGISMPVEIVSSDESDEINDELFDPLQYFLSKNKSVVDLTEQESMDFEIITDIENTNKITKSPSISNESEEMEDSIALSSCLNQQLPENEQLPQITVHHPTVPIESQPPPPPSIPPPPFPMFSEFPLMLPNPMINSHQIFVSAPEQIAIGSSDVEHVSLPNNIRPIGFYQEQPQMIDQFSWKAARTFDGHWYYYNPFTGQSEWERPSGVHVQDIDDVPQQQPTTQIEDSNLNTNDQEKTTSLQSTTNSTSEKQGSEKSTTTNNIVNVYSKRSKFKYDLSKYVKKLLMPYMKSTCVRGRISTSDDFKYLVKKFTLSIVEKETDRCNRGIQNSLELSKRVEVKTAQYVNEYMAKMPKVYKRVR